MTTITERGEFPHVLLVEDNQGDATLVKLAFKRAGIPGKITIAETGEIGLAILRGEVEHGQGRQPDIVLLDLNLPKMHGLALLKLAKSDLRTAHIPVIILSSSSAETEVAAGYAGQASGFITKPFCLDDYEEVVSGIGAYWFKLVQTPAMHGGGDDVSHLRTGTSSH